MITVVITDTESHELLDRIVVTDTGPDVDSPETSKELAGAVRDAIEAFLITD